MKTSNNTILITGGTAGIGYAIAKALIAENKVIVTGRNQDKIDKAVAALPGLIGVRSDVSSAEDVLSLLESLKINHPTLNMVINNAGAATYNDVLRDADVFEKAKLEMITNYLSVIRLNQLLMPGLIAQPTADIVNVSSIAAFVPGAKLATYAATKAALHSYTQAIRFMLRDTSVKVFEIMPPLVATEFSSGIGGLENGIAPNIGYK